MFSCSIPELQDTDTEAALSMTDTPRHLEVKVWISPETNAGIGHSTAGNNRSPAGVGPRHRDPQEVSLRSQLWHSNRLFRAME